MARRSINYWISLLDTRSLEYWEVREILKDLVEVNEYLVKEHCKCNTAECPVCKLSARLKNK